METEKVMTRNFLFNLMYLFIEKVCLILQPTQNYKVNYPKLDAQQSATIASSIL